MDAFSTLILVVLRIAIWIVAPILAWVVFFRSRNAIRDRANLHSELKAFRSDLASLRKTVQALKDTGGFQEGTAPAEVISAAEPTVAKETAAPLHEEQPPAEKRTEEERHPEEAGKKKVVEVPAIPALPALPQLPVISAVAKAPEKDTRAVAARVEGGAAAEPLVTQEVQVAAELPDVPHREQPDRTLQGPKAISKTALGRIMTRASTVLTPADQREADWETRIGRNWLNIIGIVVLVVGLVLLIQQTILYLDALGKIALGTVVGLLLVGGGLYQEKRESYRVFARTLVGGGWALLYFTAYAAYNIDAAKIIEDEMVALIALLVTAAAIIAHSFVYRSQFVTGLAYGLGFLALHLSPISFNSLVAVAILAGSILFVIRFTDWRMIGLLTVVATYGTHARWLWATEVGRDLGAAEMVLAGLNPQTAFWANMSLLAVYWVIFCATALVRPPMRQSAQLMDLGVSVLNMVGLLTLCAWQMTEHMPGNLHFLAAPATIAFAAIAIVDRLQERPLLSQFNGTVAVVLYVSALPLALGPEDLSTDWLAPYWTFGAAVTWLIGRRIGRALYRYEAYAIGLLALTAALLNNFQGRMVDHDPLLWYAALATLLLFEGFAEILRKERKSSVLTLGDLNFGQLSVPACAALISAAVWSIVAPYEAGIAWIVIGFLLFEVGGRSVRPLLRFQGHLLGIAAFLAFGIFNLGETQIAGDLPGWSYALAGAGLFYLASARLLFAGWPISKTEIALGSAPAALATILFAVSTYQALPLEAACIAWIVWALVLQEVGGRRNQIQLRYQGYLLGIAAFLAFGIFNLGEAQATGDLPGWSYTLAGSGLFYLASARLLFAGWPISKTEIASGSAPAALATILFAVSTYQALPLETVCIAWIVWALVLQQVGRMIAEARISAQGLALGAAAFAIAVAVNVYQTAGPLTPTMVPNWLALGLVTAGLYLLHVRARVGKKTPEVNTVVKSGVFLHGATLLLALLVWRELPSVTVALAWAALGLALFELSVLTGEVTLRRQSHLLMLAAFVRLFMANFITPGEAFGISHRIITVTPIIVTLYYLRARMMEVLPATASSPSKFYRVRERGFGASLYAWAAAILLVVLARFEVGSAYAVAVWAPIFAAFLVLGLRWDNRDFRFQSYLLAILLFARSWSTNAYLEGTLFGLSERIVTAVPAIVALLFAAIHTPRKAEKPAPPAKTRVVRFLQSFDSNARTAFALLFSLLVAVLIFYQMSIDMVSIGWTVEALFLFIMGFTIKERSFRIIGLVLLLVCLLKVTLLDLQGVETIYRIFSFIVLGLILLLVSLGYSRYRQVMERYF